MSICHFRMFRTVNENFRYRIFQLFFQIGVLIPYLFSILLVTGIFYILIHPLMQSLNNINRLAKLQDNWRIFVLFVYFIDFLGKYGCNNCNFSFIFSISDYYLCNLLYFLYSVWRYRPAYCFYFKQKFLCNYVAFSVIVYNSTNSPY